MSNILPYQHKKHITQLRLLRVITASLWVLVLLVGAAGVLLIPQLVMVNAHYAIATAEIDQLERSGAISSPVDVAALEQRVTALSTKLAAPTTPAPTTYIATVRSVAGPSITLSGFALESVETGSSLEVSGIASTREALQKFVDALQHTDGIASVDSPVSNYVKSTATPFKITVTFAKS